MNNGIENSMQSNQGGRMHGIKNKPKCKEDCTEHIFQLKNNNGNNKLETRISFCPKFKRDPTRPQKTIPQYNLDNRFYTHAFVLGTQKRALQNNAQHQQMHFQTMIKDACEKNNQVFFPKPNQKNSFCSVCKQHYRNYYEHINSEPHHIKIDAAIYNTQIKKLVDFYKDTWDGAHAKADEIIQQLFRQSELLKSKKGTEDDEQQQANESAEMDDEENSQVEVEDGDENEQLEKQQEGDEMQQQKGGQQMEDQAKQSNKMQQQKSKQQNNEHQNLPYSLPQQKIALDEKQKTINNNSQSFFQKRSDFVIFLHKNINGKYQVIRNVEKFKKANSTTSQPVNQKQKKIVHEDRMILRDRDERKKVKDGIKSGKQSREIYKIKHPPKQKKQLSSSYRDSSSFRYNQEQGLCQNLKNKLQSDRIRTRNQRKQQQVGNRSTEHHKNQNQQQNVKQKHKNKKISGPANHIQPEISQHPYVYYNQPNLYGANNKNINPMENHSGRGHAMQIPPNYPMYMAHHGQQSPNTGKPNPVQMGPNGYMGHPPHMMMNHPPPYFNPNLMPYGMPPPMRQQNVNNNPNKSKQKQDQPQFPMFCPPNSWNSYLMMRPEGNADQSGYSRQSMNTPQGQGGLPPQGQGMPKQGQNPGQIPNMGMYMPYPMDPRVYMRYPPAYMQKKNEQPPRGQNDRP